MTCSPYNSIGGVYFSSRKMKLSLEERIAFVEIAIQKAVNDYLRGEVRQLQDYPTIDY